MTRVLVIGLDPAKPAGWDPEPVQAAIARGRARFDEHGITAAYCLVSPDERPGQAVEEALTGTRRHAPDAAIAFTSSPEDCADAALR
ncbi:hypothetical protein AB0J40_08595 [Amycolatopsis sp. NPDC049691]|uniref:hypothetical protein n=1 Tax=Amycolatopsis sp. NPDC049691 TaxID=3155155 RepID=UPI00342F980C